MNKELNYNLIQLANPFHKEESHCEPRPSTACSSHSETFIWEKYLIDNFPHLLTPRLDKEIKNDIKSYLLSKIALCEQDIAQANRLEKEYDNIIYCKSKHEEFWKAVCAVCFLDPLTLNQTRTIKYYSHLLKQLSTTNPATGGVTPGQIAQAKLYPITDLVTFKRNFARCPFHTEDTASFHYNKKNNTARCFGSCAKTFDSIELYRRLNNCSFVEAVRKLQ